MKIHSKTKIKEIEDSFKILNELREARLTEDDMPTTMLDKYKRFKADLKATTGKIKDVTVTPFKSGLSGGWDAYKAIRKGSDSERYSDSVSDSSTSNETTTSKKDNKLYAEILKFDDSDSELLKKTIEFIDKHKKTLVIPRNIANYSSYNILAGLSNMTTIDDINNFVITQLKQKNASTMVVYFIKAFKKFIQT